MKHPSRFLSAYLFFSVCALMGYLIIFYGMFVLALPSGGILILTDAYHEKWLEAALLLFTAPGVVLSCKHLIAHWFT